MRIRTVILAGLVTGATVLATTAMAAPVQAQPVTTAVSKAPAACDPNDRNAPCWCPDGVICVYSQPYYEGNSEEDPPSFTITRPSGNWGYINSIENNTRQPWCYTLDNGTQDRIGAGPRWQANQVIPEAGAKYIREMHAC